MIDKEQIATMAKDIERYFDDLQTIHVENKKDLEIPEKKHAVSMLVFSILNRTIDIANEIIAGSLLPAPASYRDAFEVLKQGKIINPQTARKLTELIKYRNIIAH